MRSRRLIRMRGRRKDKEALDVDITSLLDILVILLCFLLKSYSASGIIVSVPEGVTLPYSQSTSLNSEGVMVQVSPTKIWVDNELILDVNESQKSRVYDHGGRRIIALYNELVKKRKATELVKKNAERAKPFTGLVNLVVDKSIKYNYLKKLMYTSAEAGYQKYKFVVMGEQ